MNISYKTSFDYIQLIELLDQGEGIVCILSDFKVALAKKVGDNYLVGNYIETADENHFDWCCTFWDLKFIKIE